MTYNRNLVFAAACMGMLTFGIVMTVLGAILPSVTARFGVDMAEAGSLLLLMSLGILAGSVVFGPVVDRYGYRGLLIACTALVVAGLEGIAFAPSFAVLRAAVFVVGVGGGGINGGTNALVADVSGAERSARLSLLGVFFGVGAFGIPFGMGFLLEHFTYASLVAGVGGLGLVPLVFCAALRFPAPKQVQGFPLAQGVGLLKDPVLLLMGLVLFLQSGIEITTGGWTTTYFSDVLALAPEDAQFVLSIFWAGMIAARLLLGVLLRTQSPARVLRAFIGVGLCGAVVLLAAADARLAAVGVCLTGFGLAAGFPVVYGYAGERYAHLTGTAFGLLLVMALTGGSLLPYATGLLGEAFGLRPSFVLIPVCLVAQLALLGVVLRRMGARVGTNAR